MMEKPFPEILSPAGSFEALKAAVQSGADAVYLGGGRFNARHFAKNFGEEELRGAVEYCHVRGCRVYITLNTLMTDRELSEVSDTVRFYCDIGADALIVQDFGLAAALREWAPDMPLFASTQMSVHSLEGAKRMAALGFSRVVLARELSREDMAILAKACPIETEVFVHGALCVCHSGQCYMSAVIGRRSGNRGRCAQPCRLPYEGGHLLSLKDLCMAPHLPELARLGVTSLKIEGRMKRPEYVSAVTRVYSRAVKEGVPPTEKELSELEAIFSRSGFTDGYFEGRTGPFMLGVREEGDPVRVAPLLAAERARWENGEAQRVAVRLDFTARPGEPLALSATDAEGNTVRSEGEAPSMAHTRATEEGQIEANLRKTGGTPFYAGEIRVSLASGLAVPAGAVNALRREALDKLAAMRALPPVRGFHEIDPLEPCGEAPAPASPALEAVFASVDQLPANADRLSRVWLPLELAAGEEGGRIFSRLAGRAGVLLPRAVLDGEYPRFESLLRRCREYGCGDALGGGLGELDAAIRLGYVPHGDFGLNVMNSRSLLEYSNYGLRSATLSFELRTSQIRDMKKPLPSGILAYGRLPLMLLERCVAKPASRCSGGCKMPRTLTDRQGERFLLMREFGCRNQLLNGKPLYLADRLSDFAGLGLSFMRLHFTDEDVRTAEAVIDAYGGAGGAPPEDFTRGLYFKGVE